MHTSYAIARPEMFCVMGPQPELTILDRLIPLGIWLLFVFLFGSFAFINPVAFMKGLSIGLLVSMISASTTSRRG